MLSVWFGGDRANRMVAQVELVGIPGFGGATLPSVLGSGRGRGAFDRRQPTASRT